MYNIFCSRQPSRKSFTLTFPRILAKLVKNYPGITVPQRLTVQRLMVLPRERYAELRKELLHFCCNQAWNKNGGRIPWNITAICEMFKTSWQMGKLPYERRLGEPFKRPVIPFGLLTEYHPIAAKDLSRLHQFGKTVLPGKFLGYALYAGRIWKGDVLVADLGELAILDVPELHARRVNAKEVLTPQRCENFKFPIADGTPNLFGRGHGVRQFNAGTTL